MAKRSNYVEFKRKVSQKELEMREYKRKVKELYEKADEEMIEVRRFKHATPNDVCVLSKNEFEIGEHPKDCDLKNEPYFVDEFDYEYFW